MKALSVWTKSIAHLLEEGRFALVPNSPEFSYLVHVMHSTKADLDVMARIRSGSAR